MGTLITGSVFFGAVLGQSFKVLVLIPASLVAIALLLLERELAGQMGLGLLLGFTLLISLELGYFMGLMAAEISGIADAP